MISFTENELILDESSYSSPEIRDDIGFPLLLYLIDLNDNLTFHNKLYCVQSTIQKTKNLILFIKFVKKLLFN